MKKAIMGAVLAGALVFGAGAAVAENPGAQHNCAGAASSLFAQELPPGVFGAIVSTTAKEQQVDNGELRNCGNAQGQNP